MSLSVLITGKVPREWAAELDGLARVNIWEGEEYLMPRTRLLAMIGEYNALINFAEVKADEAFISSASKLRIIANCSIGFDNLDLSLLTANGIWASNAPGFFNYPVAEYALTGILAVLRRLPEADDFVRKGKWQAFEPGRWDGFSLKEKTVGIIGLGSIGKALRAMLVSLGAEVIYNTREPAAEAGWTPFDELVRMSDVISIHVPLTAETVNLLDRKTIGKVKPGVIIVNTSRGVIIDQDALVQALRSGLVGGAVLDVFRDEPDVPVELLEMKNVLLTPHIAGGTRSAREACVKRAVQNVRAALAGERPVNALNEVR
ncbi:NAD(P)-dependent oxidoreductase [Agriterribacter sp.]|uniref:2-hydroxyacid dehydrogenase n=1 Tax=Agriterribacter sp. TaxID=2821509 RepID=UPI002D05239A|nr:NAD(P)-dependent oxidoreductase [Agriterribacter sp.]HRP55915.1 NAD(P)-dependent oxidoreductase [Agriterribacter sp.]